MKSSFILYTDFYDVIKDLTDEQIGKLHRAIYIYQLEDKIIELDAITKMAFKFIRLQLDKNKSKWEETKEKRTEAGKKGSEKRWGVSQEMAKIANANFAINDKTGEKQEMAKIANANFAINDKTGEKQEMAKIAVNVHDNVNVNEDVNVINKKDISSEQRVATEPEPPEKQEIVQNEADMTEMVEPEDIKIAPNELQGLFLYEKDVRLVKLWPELISAWKLAFPGIDIVAEVKAAHAWEVANPKKRKVDRARFLQNWMAKSQDKYGGRIFGGKRNNSTNYDFNER